MMTPEDLQRMEELALLSKRVGLDAEERAELKELRALALAQKESLAALAMFNAAETVYKVIDPAEGDFYLLDLATVEKFKAGTGGSENVEEVDRRTLTGVFEHGQVFVVETSEYLDCFSPAE